MKYGISAPPLEQVDLFYGMFDENIESMVYVLPPEPPPARRRDVLMRQCAEVADLILQERVQSNRTAANAEAQALALRARLPATSTGNSPPRSGRKRDKTRPPPPPARSCPGAAALSADTEPDAEEEKRPKHRKGFGWACRPKGDCGQLPPPLREFTTYRLSGPGPRARGAFADLCGLGARGPHADAGPGSCANPGAGPAHGFPRERPSIRCRTKRGLSGDQWRHEDPDAPFHMVGGSYFCKGEPPIPPLHLGKGVAGCSRAGACNLPSIAAHGLDPELADRKRARPYAGVFEGAARELRSGEAAIETRLRSKHVVNAQMRPPAAQEPTSPRLQADAGGWLPQVPAPPRAPRPPPPRPSPCPPPLPMAAAAVPDPTPRQAKGVQQGRVQGYSGSHNVLPGLCRDTRRPSPPRPARPYVDHEGRVFMAPGD
eukprot:TRINITY_DN9925_c0_g1_i1.p1 TRINITY_DN9925_c0_g1~~TRINITY_DN9925_c0_g1_i1.p1  ORF type:complete len:430 (+),score=70.53 TRINITY_DN9925_c0_g1_i1:97-1386(+)